MSERVCLLACFIEESRKRTTFYFPVTATTVQHQFLLLSYTRK